MSEAMYSAGSTAPSHVVHPSLTRGGRGETGPAGGGSNVVHAGSLAASATTAAASSATPWDVNAASGAAGSDARAGGTMGFGTLSGSSVMPGATMTVGSGAGAENVRRRQNHHTHGHHRHPPGAGGRETGASTDRPTVGGSYQATPLGLASERGDVPAVNVFLRDGHDPDAPGPRGNRPLHYAAYEGHGKVLELLLAGGRADPNARNNQGVTPLHNAAQRGNLECIDALVASGADVNAVDVDQATPLHASSERRAMEALLRAGADPNSRRRDGRTPLHEAAERGDGWAVEALLGLGAQPDARESIRGRTALHSTSDWRCTRALAAAGADVEAVADDGLTPLQTAAVEGKAEVVAQLLEAGAKVNARTAAALGGIRRGKTATDLAREHGHAEVVRLLEEEAADPGGARRKKNKAGGGIPGPPWSGWMSGRTVLIVAVVALLLVVAGLVGIHGMQRELKEWRDLRARKAARKATKDAAAAAKKREEEEAAKRRAAAAEAEVARVLACPSLVAAAAADAAAEAARANLPKPKKDPSAVHRCVLALGGPGGGQTPGAAEGTCQVCEGFLTPVSERLRIDLAGTASRGSGEGERAAAADRALGAACAAAEEAGNGRHTKLCDSLLALRREVARPLGLGVPPSKVCERLARKDPLVCEIKPAREGDVTNDGAGDAAATDAFKRLSLLVHPDKHKGKHSGPANSAFRMLKAARDHFDLKAKREMERRKREEEGEGGAV